ncbi:Uma2 family endonuclease [Thermus scotoductus]|uniref:Uma2 family endonuclease n=1 Tax=Thermus scotoductus TaxID=37636 RepID=UPI001FD2D89E|nr:Uma2 family endonuclease [Thermus scotoductus]
MQNPLLLSPTSLPQPDLALLRPREDFNRTRLPQAEDVLLVVEVSLSTRELDEGVKLPLYAQAGIPEVGLVGADTLEVYREPKGSRYRLRLLLEPGEGVAPLLLEGPPFPFDPPRGTPPA